MRKFTYRIAAVLVTGMISTVTACGYQGNAIGGSYPVALINGRAIHSEQVDHVVESLSAGKTAEQVKQLTAVVLEQLINEELLNQQALALKLDSTPRFLRTMAAERRRVLAQSYLDGLKESEPPQSQQDISQFFSAHASLFERRRIYQTYELAAAVPDGMQESFIAAVTAAADMDEIAAWLKTRNLKYREAASTLPSEHIVAEVLEQLTGLEDAEIAILRFPNIVLVVQLLHSRDAPLTEEEATPFIAEALGSIRQRELLARTVQRLRREATIEYPPPPDGVPAEPGKPGRKPDLTPISRHAQGRIGGQNTQPAAADGPRALAVTQKSPPDH